MCGVMCDFADMPMGDSNPNRPELKLPGWLNAILVCGGLVLLAPVFALLFIIAIAIGGFLMV